MRKKGKKKKDKDNKMTPFEKIISEVAAEYTGEKYLEECMKFPVDAKERIARRHRLIALGFVKGSTLDEVNESLAAGGCEKLYARSLWEMTLSDVFLNGLSYKECMKLHQIAKDARSRWGIQEKWFPGGKITVPQLEGYIRENSGEPEECLVTGRVTKRMEQVMKGLDGSEREYRTLLLDNLEHFSKAREKTKYYFCKYLCRYLWQKIEDAAKAVGQGKDKDAIFEDMNMFQIITVSKRKKRAPKEIRELFRNAPISCRGIFDAFDNFYFGYVTTEWKDILWESYGKIEVLSEEKKAELAEKIRSHNPSLKEKTNDEVIEEGMRRQEQKECSLDEKHKKGEKKSYQSGRNGENVIRKYIRGVLDVDRTTLICFLLFFSSGTELPPEEVLSRERLDNILEECGFYALDNEREFDDFILYYMEAEDPASYLVDEVMRYAQMEKNSPLYKTFLESRSMEEEWEKLGI